MAGRPARRITIGPCVSGPPTGREGMTIVPLVMYFNDKGLVKLKIATAKGKQNHDKRATEAKWDWDRQKARVIRENG